MVNTRIFRLAADLQQAFEVGGVGGKRAVGSDDGLDVCGGKFGQGAEGLQEAAAVYPDAFGRAPAQGVAFAVGPTKTDSAWRRVRMRACPNADAADFFSSALNGSL